MTRLPTERLPEDLISRFANLAMERALKSEWELRGTGRGRFG